MHIQMPRLFFLIALLVLIINAETFQYPLKPESGDPKSLLDSDQFTRLVNETLNEWHVPGVALALVDGNGIHTRVRQFIHLAQKATFFC